MKKDYKYDSCGGTGSFTNCFDQEIKCNCGATSKKEKLSKKNVRALQLKDAAVNFMTAIDLNDYGAPTDADLGTLVLLLNKVYKMGVKDGRK